MRRERDKLVKELMTAKYAAPRESLIGRAMAVFLAEGRIGEPELEALVRDLKSLRVPLIKLGREYNSAPDERKITIRETILRQGIPGDPVVRRMWGFKKFPR